MFLVIFRSALTEVFGWYSEFRNIPSGSAELAPCLPCGETASEYYARPRRPAVYRWP
jgi:hypothetical protein